MYFKRAIAASLACLMLAGCAGSDTSDSSKNSSSSNNSNESIGNSDNAVPEGAGSEVPLLEIETVSKESNAMDFITKPINGYVAKSIASWTPGFKIPDEFVIGYGLDYADYYRNLPYIGVLKEECYQ